MNWGTAVAVVAERAGKSAAEYDRIQRKLCDGTQILKYEQLRWTQARGSVTLTAGFGSYAPTASTGVAAGLPADVVAITSQRFIDLDYAGDAQNRMPIEWVPRETMDSYRRGSTLATGPRFWTFWDERLELYPASDLSTHIVRFPYLQDLGTLTYRKVAGIWKFYRPDGTTELTTTDTYTNAWLTQGVGFNLLTNWSLWKCWSDEWKGEAGQAQRAGESFAEALAKAKEGTNLQNLPQVGRPWTPNFPGQYYGRYGLYVFANDPIK